mmetsp:Transcript_9612/g.18111  ORF Transcript_9612/g.18111 Transcript_9612/m.18111 type:complete len:325 (-) Transcript_9612:463-1437(-)
MRMFWRQAKSWSATVKRLTNVEIYISVLFWYSLIITSLTPLERMHSGRWKTHTLPATFHETYPNDKTNHRAFGLHAFFAICWLVSAYVQIVFVKSKVVHRRFGYMTTGLFCAHALGALQVLVADVEKHTLFNRALLLGSVINTSTIFIEAIRLATRGRMQLHRDLMYQVFIMSLDGAGTIRTVNTIIYFLGGKLMCGLTKYKNHASTGEILQWEFTVRLLGARYLQFLQRYILVKLLGQEHLCTSLLKEVHRFSVVSCLSFIVYLTGRDQIHIVIIITILYLYSELAAQYSGQRSRVAPVLKSNYLNSPARKSMHTKQMNKKIS